MLDRLADIVGGKVYENHTRPMFQWTAHHHDALTALAIMWPYLGEMKKDQALAVVGRDIEPWPAVAEPLLLQCKLGGYMRPAEREELIELAKRYGCRPVMVGRKPFTFTDLTTGGQIEPPDSIRGTEAPR